MPLPLNIRFVLWLDRLRNVTPMESLPPHVARRASEKWFLNMLGFIDYKPAKMADISERTIGVSHGEKITLRIYRPVQSETPLPVVMYFHGGGFVVGSLEVYDRACRRLAHDNQAVVVSVDYRLAPEYKFPTAPEDCYAATQWVVSHAADLGIDPERLAIMGDSAGGNLAGTVAMMARDRGGPVIKKKVLIYPVTDGKMRSQSYRDLEKGYFLTRSMMEWFLGQYQRTSDDLAHPYFTILDAANLSNLPETLVITAEYDPLRDEGNQYAQKLKAADNLVQHTEYRGMIHGFFLMPKYSRSARQSIAEVNGFLAGL